MEYKYAYVKGGGKKRINITLIIALISFIISVYTFYLANFSVDHSLKVSYDLIRINEHDGKFNITCRAFFQNSGNRTEGILYSNMYLNEGLMANYFHTRIDSAFLVPKGDAQIREYNFAFDIDSTFIYHSKSFDIVVLYRITGNRGVVFESKQKLIHLSVERDTLHVSDDDIFGRYRWTYKDLMTDKNIELITN
jgi:hypothetical protein